MMDANKGEPKVVWAEFFTLTQGVLGRMCMVQMHAHV